MSDLENEPYPLKDAIYGLMDAVRYMDFISANVCNDLVEFEHNEKYDETFQLILDLLGVPADTYDDKTDTGFSRDWIYDRWFDMRLDDGDLTNEGFVGWLGQEIELAFTVPEGLPN